MSPRTKEQLEEHRSGKRIEIFDAALKVFSAHGYNDATVSMIAREAGIAKGLLYTYFKSKEELLEELLIYGLMRLREYFEFVPAKGIKTKKDFETVLRSMVELYTKESDFWRLYTIIMLQKNTTPRFEEIMQGMIQEYLSIFMVYFEKKKVENPFVEAMLLGSMLDGLMFDVMIAPDMFPVEDIVKLIVKKFG